MCDSLICSLLLQLAESGQPLLSSPKEAHNTNRIIVSRNGRRRVQYAAHGNTPSEQPKEDEWHGHCLGDQLQSMILLTCNINSKVFSGLQRDYPLLKFSKKENVD